MMRISTGTAGPPTTIDHALLDRAQQFGRSRTSISRFRRAAGAPVLLEFPIRARGAVKAPFSCRTVRIPANARIAAQLIEMNGSGAVERVWT